MRRELAVLVLIASLGGALGCGNAPCARHSDCATGLTCSVDGVCLVAQDAGADGGPDGDGGEAAADASVEDAAVDASVEDAPDDAGPDAPVDGGP